MDKKVFSVYLGDPDRSNHAELDLPATPWELIDALDKLRLVDGREPYWQVEDIGRYGFLAPLLDDSDLYQFNALAEQLSTFDHVEAIAFEGLVQMEVDKLCQTNGGELTLQRLLDLAYSVDCCHVVPGIRDDAALGRFYVENEFLPELEQVPDSVLELLDYAKIGEKMRRDEHGAMTPNGYVVREAELRQAPPNLGRPPRKPPYMIHFLCVSDVRAVKLYLPAKQAELDAVLDCLEVDSWQEVQLEECDTAMPEMWAFVDMAHTSMEQVNQFAQCLEMLDANGELAAFKAVASQLDIYKLEDAMALTEHLSEYAFESNIHSLEDRAREELSLMADGPELDLLIRNLNLTAYGADLMYRDRGILSDYGYVPAIPTLRIITWYTAFSYMGSVRNIWILAEQKQKMLWKINLSGALLNVIANYILIPLIGINGAAIASVATQLFVNFVLCFMIPSLRPVGHLIIEGIDPRNLKELWVGHFSNPFPKTKN